MTFRRARSIETLEPRHLMAGLTTALSSNTLRLTGGPLGARDTMVLDYDGRNLLIDLNGQRIAASNIQSIELDAGSGSDTVLVKNLPPSVALFVWGGEGSDTITVERLPHGARASINGSAGNDVVTLGNGTTAGIYGSVFVENTFGRTSLNVVDSSAAGPRSIVMDVADGIGSIEGFTPAGIPIRFAADEMSAVEIHAGLGANTLRVHGVIAGTDVIVSSGSGGNTVYGPETMTDWTLLARHAGRMTSPHLSNGSVAFRGFSKFVAGASDDWFMVLDGASVATLDGGGGRNQLDYSERSAAVKVDLQSTRAPGVTQSTLRIQDVIGTEFDDVLMGNALDNYLDGREGNDRLEGRDGNDLLNDDHGHNKLFGGNGDDLIDCGNGNDFVNGGAGNDEIYGGGGRDELRGGDGHDKLSGEGGLDQLFGEGGSDWLEGESDGELDLLFGGAGADTFVSYYWMLTNQFGSATEAMRDFAAGDRMSPQLVDRPGV